MSRALRLLLAMAAIAAPGAAFAGPPFLTDDPEPTDTGHWEIYAPLLEISGRGIDYEGSIGAELNYGAAPNLQLTAGLPVAYAHDGVAITGAGVTSSCQPNTAFSEMRRRACKSPCSPASPCRPPVTGWAMKR